MDVHRCRFVPFEPSAINAVAFSHPTATSQTQMALARMAVGRANGDIEIWNPSKGSWHQELVLHGGKDRSIEGLVWVNEPNQDLGDGRVLLGKSRLFSIGYTSTVTEWDLEKGKPKRHASGQHGDIWCMAVQPPSTGSEKPSANGTVQELRAANKLVAGTIDGEVVMYSLEDDDLRFQRVVVRSPTKKAQMVSITFQSRKVVIIGCTDGTIRAYDITNGHMLRRMTLGSDLVGGSKEIIAWSVQCLPGGNIVSGDSAGQVCIWDGKTYTQMQRIHGHKQDILSLATSADGTSIMSGGMDRRMVLYKQSAGPGKRWSKVWGRRYHEHDVKAMACFESGRVSAVVTGGPDTALTVVPLKKMGRENHRTLSNLPQQAPIASAPKARFVLSWWGREVHLWVLRKPATEIFSSANGDVDLDQNRKLLKTIVIKGDFNISSATINEDASLLIVSTAADVKAFRLEHHDPEKPSDLKLSTIELPPKLTRLGACRVQLSPDSSWLCLVQEGVRVLLAKVEHTDDDQSFKISPQNICKVARLRRDIPRYIQNGGLGNYDRNITHIAFSPDSRMVATADLAGYIDTWVLRGQSGELPKGTQESETGDASSESDSSDSEAGDVVPSSSESWVRNPSGKLLPKLPTPAVLSFAEDVPVEDADDYTLLCITRSWNLRAFHPLKGTSTPWSRRHPRQALPPPVLDLLDGPKGIVWQGPRAWIYGVSFLIMIDLSQDLPKPAGGIQAPTEQISLKRKRTGHRNGAGGKMVQSNLTPHQVSKHVNDQEEDVDMDEAPPDDESNSDDDMDDPGEELAQLRNADSNGGHAGSLELAETGTQRNTWWMTYKYRPILGVVPLGDDELVLVERPMWDVELPQRYFKGEEWER